MKPCADSSFELAASGDFSYRLEVNKKDLSAELYKDGKKVFEWSNICAEPCEIILVMKNASIELDKVLFEQI